MNKYIVKNEITPDCIWYVCEIFIAGNFPPDPENKWLIQCTQTQKIHDAMRFSKEKAELLAYIENHQPDEEGYTGKWGITLVESS